MHGLLPVYLVSTLGASVLTVGLIEGTSEAAALIVKVFSGAISDFFSRRKALILLGYGMAALTKPLFPLAMSAESVFIARFLIGFRRLIPPARRPQKRLFLTPDSLGFDEAPPARTTCSKPRTRTRRLRTPKKFVLPVLGGQVRSSSS